MAAAFPLWQDLHPTGEHSLRAKNTVSNADDSTAREQGYSLGVTSLQCSLHPPGCTELLPCTKVQRQALQRRDQWFQTGPGQLLKNATGQLQGSDAQSSVMVLGGFRGLPQGSVWRQEEGMPRHRDQNFHFTGGTG